MKSEKEPRLPRRQHLSWLRREPVVTWLEPPRFTLTRLFGFPPPVETAACLRPSSERLVAGSLVDCQALPVEHHTTGAAAGSAVAFDVCMELAHEGLPITRVADGTTTGHIVLGFHGLNTVPL